MTDAASPIADPTPARKSFALPLPAAWVFLACLLLALLCNIGGLLGQGFIGAENELVRDNDLLNRLPGLQAIWFRVSSPSTYPLSQYAPMAQTMFFVEHAFWGDLLWPYRLVSVLLHAGVGLMVWMLLRRLGIGGAFVAAMLFVAHPTTVDSVSWIAERRNPLAALLGVCAAYLLLRASGVIAAGTGKLKLLPDEPARLYGLGAVLFILGLCSNAAIATLPLVLLLVVWWKRRAPDPVFTAVCVALLLAGIGLLGVSSSVEQNRAGVTSPAAWNRATSSAGELAVRTQIAGRAIVFYAEKLVLPYPVAIDYARWQTPRDVEQYRAFTLDAARATAREADVSPADVVAWLFPLAVAAAVVASWSLRKRLGRGQFLAVAAFIILLAPTLGFIDLGWMRYSFVSNRAIYFASIPFTAGFTWLAGLLLAAAKDRTVTITSSIIAVTLCVVLSFSVSRRFHRPDDFWIQNARAVATVKSWWPRYELARLMLTEADPIKLNQGVQAVEEVRRFRPDEPGALVLLGLYKQRNHDELGAIRDFEASIENFPQYAPAYYELGDSFRVQADRKPTDPKPRMTALQFFNEAADHDPSDVFARVKLGQTAWEVARRLDPSDKATIDQYMDKAAESFDQAVQLRPYDVTLLVTLAQTLVDMRKLSDAAGLLETARTIAPDRADLYVVIAEAALARQDYNGAEAALHLAITLDPEMSDAHLQLGILSATLEHWTEARAQFDAVLELDPKNVEAARRLAEVNTAATTRPEASASTKAVP